MKNPFKDFTITATGSFGQDKTIEAIRRWVEGAGGTFSSQVTKTTTHLLCSPEEWKKQSIPVKLGHKHKVKMVTFDWLEDSLRAKTHKREGPYLLERVERAAKKERIRKKNEEEAVIKDVASFEAGCTNAKQDLKSGTLSWVSAHAASAAAKKREVRAARKAYIKAKNESLKADKKADRAAQRAAAGEPSSSQPRSSPSCITNPDASTVGGDEGTHLERTSASLSPSFGQIIDGDGSGEKATKHVSSSPETIISANRANGAPDNHHIYRDSTGFDYNITLTRIFFKTNTNERYTLRLYESHTEPHTYAFHLAFSASGKLPKPKAVVPIGAGFYEAFKKWRETFFKYTRVKWEEREVKGAVKDVRSMEYIESYGGVEAAIKARILERGEYGELDARVTPFKYLPPGEGQPRGDMMGMTAMVKSEARRRAERASLYGFADAANEL